MALAYFRALFLPYAGKMIRAGWSADAILLNVADFGWDVPRPWAMRNIARLSTQDRLEPIVRAADPARSLGRDMMQQGTVPRGHLYYATYGVGDYDPETDSWSGGQVSMYSDENLGEDGWSKDFEETFGTTESGIEAIGEGISLLGVVHARGAPY